MCEIPISSHEILEKMIHFVYEKAIYEPAFGDIYAELCSRLSLKTIENPFVKIIESDEEPLTDDELAAGRDMSIISIGNITSYRWSNDVAVNDAEIIGPFSSPEECIEMAGDATKCPQPEARGDKELILHSLKIVRGVFIKIMTLDNDLDSFFTVFFPMSRAKEIGQQFSDQIFLSERECSKDSTKANSFKSILLNKCEDEFKKQDIFVTWQSDKKAYDKSKSKLKATERLSEEEELEFRRMKIKKQMLGNIRFIGELYKKGMLKARIMMFCVNDILKLTEVKEKKGQKGTKAVVRLIESESGEMDEEDHEAVCKLFITIGSTIDTPGMHDHMTYYFNKMKRMSNDKRLNSRVRFMYRDLMELRNNNWKARREQETTKTLDEIRRDVEKEERLAAQQSQSHGGGGYRGGRGGGGMDRRGGHGSTSGRGGDNRGGDNRRGGRGGGDYREDSRRGDNMTYGSNRSNRPQKDRNVVKDQDGFTEVLSRGAVPPSSFGSAPPPRKASSAVKSPARTPREPSPPPAPPAESTAFPKDKVELRAKNMLAEFMESKGDEDNLLMSMDDLKDTPGAGVIIVQVLLDKSIDSKDAECKAIISLISILYKKRKISRPDIQSQMSEMVEFLDAFLIDSPNALRYVTNMLAEFIALQALEVSWLCDKAKLHQERNPQLIPKIIEHTVDTFKLSQGAEKAKATFDLSKACLSTLLGADAWDTIYKTKLM